MNPLIQKIKYVVLSWLAISVAGGFAISAGLESHLAAYIALVSLSICYYASQKWYLPPTRIVESGAIETEAKEFINEIEKLKQRAGQIYLVGLQSNRNIDTKTVDLLYKQALFLTIANVKENQSANVYFSRHFSQELLAQKTEKKTLSFDHLVLELTSRNHRTRLQDEYLSFVAFNLFARKKPVEEISLVYTTREGRIDIRRPFNNMIGIFFIKLLNLIEINSRTLGMHDFFELDSKDLHHKST